MKKSKNIKPTKKARPKSAMLSRIYSEFCSANDKPYPPVLFKRLADDYVEWAGYEDSLVLTKFPLLKGITPDYFWELCRANEHLARANKIAKALVACRREELMLKGKLRERPVMHIMHRYSDDWDKADKRWAELKKPEESKSQIQTIILDRLTCEGDDEKD
jgi:hypothetical protein